MGRTKRDSPKKGERRGTPYDDSYKTLLVKCIKLLIAIVNEMFDERYTSNAKIDFVSSEHFLPGDKKYVKRVSDSCFYITEGGRRKQYHIECQSTPDKNMAVRIFEYDTQISLENAEVTEGCLTVYLPNSGILYLRHNDNTPDEIITRIIAPNGAELKYPVRVLKVQQYGLSEIFAKNLLFLLPFYIFRYESQFDEYNSDAEKYNALLEDYRFIYDKLEVLTANGEIDEYYMYTIRRLINRVTESLARNYARIVKGVTAVMGGRVITCKVDRIHEAGVKEGLEKGLKKGREEGRMEGRVEGHKKGREEGRAEGRMSTLLTAVRNMIKTKGFTIGEAFDILQTTAAERRTILAQLQ